MESFGNSVCSGEFNIALSVSFFFVFFVVRVFPLSGYLPQDLIGNSEYNFVHKDDVKSLSDTYRQVLANNNQEHVSTLLDIYMEVQIEQVEINTKICEKLSSQK